MLYGHVKHAGNRICVQIHVTNNSSSSIIKSTKQTPTRTNARQFVTGRKSRCSFYFFADSLNVMAHVNGGFVVRRPDEKKSVPIFPGPGDLRHSIYVRINKKKLFYANRLNPYTKYRRYIYKYFKLNLKTYRHNGGGG